MAELASVPTADAPGIFEDWALDAAGNAYTLDDDRIVWDFGTDTQYPVLCPVDADGDGRFTSAEFGMQPSDAGTVYVYFSQAEFTVGEENGTVVVSVVMFNAPADAVMLTVLVSDGTATSPDDYTYDSSTASLSFDASSAVDLLTTATFTITIVDDDILEASETIILALDTPPGGVALAEPSTATVLILDDDARNAYDTDGDGLIEVHTVEQLNVIRYDLNGDGEIDDLTSNDPSVDGSKAAAYTFAFHGVLPSDDVSYVGYELAAALDFAGSKWSSAEGGEGWEPIGNESNRYLNTFNGNDHIITGLYINRPNTNFVGLFGLVSSDAIIRNVGLEEVSVLGLGYVGGLAGLNSGTITSSYATGDVTGTEEIVGGLVGENTKSITSSYATGTVMGTNSVGGLVGVNDEDGTITSSYATGDVSGTRNVGGLVGYTEGGMITSSYATGDVSGNHNVGGLVGHNDNGTITSSYATGDVSGDSNVGGLVGHNDNGTITSSYYSSVAVVLLGGVAVPPNAYARSIVELARVPTADAPGIFEKWAVDAAGKKKDINGTAYTLDDNRIVWDFGTNAQYPVLCPVDANEDGIFTSAEFGMQPRDIAGTYVYFAQSEFVVGEEDGTAAVSVVMLNAPADAVMLTVEYSDGTALSPSDYASDSGMVDLSFDASSAVDFLTTATFTIPIVDDSLRENTETIALSLDIDTLPSGVTLVGSSASTVFIVDDELRGAYDADGDGLIDVHDLEQLNAIRYDLNGDGEMDDLTSNNPAVAGSKAAAYVSAFHGLCPPDRVAYAGYELAADLDFADSRWMRGATAANIPDAIAEGWAPIGGFDNRYIGTFDGNGHTITGLYINLPDTDFVGLFGYVGTNAIIRGVGLAEVEVFCLGGAGSLVGINVGTITSSYATGSVTGSGTTVGGLVGLNNGSITSSYATGDVAGGAWVGGLVGLNGDDGTITASYATSTVTGDGLVGGLVGWNTNNITSSYATGDVTGNSDVGGLVGKNSNTITSSYYSGIAVVLQGGDAVPPDAYARSVVELVRVPTADAPGIFEDWAVDAAGKKEDIDGTAYTFDDDRIVWDFGTNTQYPVLCPVDADGDGRFTSAEFGTQPRDIAGTYVDFSQPEFTVGEEDGEVVVSVVMLNAPDTAVDVSVLVSDGTALSPADYMRGSGAISLSFDASSAVDLLTTATFTIPIIDDSLLEEDETIALSLDADTVPSGVTLAVPGTATVVILDDELRGAYDADGDGLIEVHDLEQLSVIRCDLDGDGEMDDLTSDDLM